jgi:nucleotide-binding universal stress UspA family protein
MVTIGKWEVHMTEQAQDPILVGVDGSPNANVAAAWTVEIGNRTKSPVKAVAAWPEIPSPYLDRIDDHVEAMNVQQIDAATESLLDAGIDGIEVTAAPGAVAEVLLNTADELDASMLVVGTRGLGLLSGLLLGSISRYLLFNTRRPLVVVPSTSTLTPPELTRVLVGLDRSSIAKRVASWAARFCADLGVPATIVRCADPGCERPPGLVEQVDDGTKEDTEKVLRPFRDLGVEYDIIVTHCDPRVALVDTATSTSCGMIVIGTRGEGQFHGLGGTASYLARHSPVPLAVVP